MDEDLLSSQWDFADWRSAYRSRHLLVPCTTEYKVCDSYTLLSKTGISSAEFPALDDVGHVRSPLGAVVMVSHEVSTVEALHWCWKGGGTCNSNKEFGT